MKKRTLRWIVAALTVLLLLCLSLWIAWGNTALTVTHYGVTHSKIPTAFDGFRILQISDLHNASFGEENGELLALMEENRPDVIVITGDLVDSRRTDIPLVLHFLERALTIAPVYYVNGNHEARLKDSYPAFEQAVAALGVRVLHNETVPLERDGQQILLKGMDDYFFMESEGDFLQTGEAMGEDELYTILLNHRPDYFRLYMSWGYELVLCGHAHGGQIRLPFVGGLIAPDQGLFPKYDAGQFSKGENCMIVSRGLGNSAFPFRVNNRPEVVVVELQAPQ